MGTIFILLYMVLNYGNFIYTTIYGSELWEPYLNQDDEKWDKNLIKTVNLVFMNRSLGLNNKT